MTWRSLCPGKYFEIQAWKWRLCFSCHNYIADFLADTRSERPFTVWRSRFGLQHLRISFRIRIWQDCLVSEMRQCRVREGNYLTDKKSSHSCNRYWRWYTFSRQQNQDLIMSPWSSFELEQWAYTQQISEESFELRISDIAMNNLWELCFGGGGEL